MAVAELTISRTIKGETTLGKMAVCESTFFRRAEVDKIAQRATPIQWAKYSTPSTLIKMFNNGNTSLAPELRIRASINERTSGRAIFHQ